MASEMHGSPDAPEVPDAYRSEALKDLTGSALEIQYRRTLEGLATEQGLLGVIFRKSQNKINHPANLKRGVTLIETGRGRLASCRTSLALAALRNARQKLSAVEVTRTVVSSQHLSNSDAWAPFHTGL